MKNEYIMEESEGSTMGMELHTSYWHRGMVVGGGKIFLFLIKVQ